jgi:hypothetical protein
VLKNIGCSKYGPTPGIAASLDGGIAVDESGDVVDEPPAASSPPGSGPSLSIELDELHARQPTDTRHDAITRMVGTLARSFVLKQSGCFARELDC